MPGTGYPDHTLTSDKNLEKQRVQWQEILTLSDRLLQLAEQKNWPELTVVHQLRDQKLTEFFEQAIEQSFIETIQTGITRIRKQDQKIVQIVQCNRDELGAESHRLKSMKSRVNEYLSAKDQKL